MSVGFFISEKGVLPQFCGKYYLIYWQDITSVSLVKKKTFGALCIQAPRWQDLGAKTEGPSLKAMRKHGVPLLWPVDDPESFKSDVLKFAPEGNPLREYVENSL
ncbi:MAG TPA: hypothetical protein V6C52_00845 [Coleofasciculaceae cyanobacterium]